MKSNKIKHIIALFLAILMSFQTVVFVAADETTDVAYEAAAEDVYKPQNLREYKILDALGVFSIYEEEDFTGNAEITRAEVAAVATRMIGLMNSFSMEWTEMPFTDVESTDTYACEINCVGSLGIMTGYNREFNPNDIITEEQFLKVVLETLGFGLEAEEVGGYPQGYSIIAGKYHILDDVDFKGNIPLTQDVAVQIVYNSLTVEMPRVISVGDGSYMKTTGQTILSQYLNVAIKQGIVEGNQNTYISNLNDTFEGIVQIDDEFYYTGTTNCEEYLGYNINFFYKNTDDDNYETILYAEPYKNEVTVLDAGEISGYASRTYSYYEEGSSNEKHIKVPLTADVIYNGVRIKPGFNAYVPEIGHVDLIDNDRNGDIDVVSITAYDIYYVKSNNINKCVLLSEDSKQVDYFDIFWKVYDVDGNKLAGSSVVIDTLLLLAVNEDRNVVTGFQVDEQIEGVVDDFSTVDSKKMVTINGYEYTAHSYSADSIGTTVKAGSNVVYFVYGDMLLVKYLPASSLTESVGYLIEAGKTLGLDSRPMVRMLLQTGKVAIVDVSKNANLVCYGRPNVRGKDVDKFIAGLIYNKQLYKVVDSAAGLPAEDLVMTNVYKNGTETTVRQPVIYKLNEAGELVYLEISPEQNSDTTNVKAIAPLSTIDGMQLVLARQSQYTRFNAGTRNVADDTLLLDTTSFVIDVPVDYQNYNAYKILPIESVVAKDVYWDTRENQLKLYRTGNDILGANIMVGYNILEPSKGVCMVVDKIFQSVTDEGVECYMIKGKDKLYKDVALKTTDKNVFNSVTNLSTGSPATITEGDYITCYKDSYGLVERISIAYDRESGIVDDKGEYTMSEYYNAGGQVYIKNGDIIGYYTSGVISDPTAVTQSTIKYIDTSKYRIVEFDSTLKKADSYLVDASVGDIKAYLDYPTEASKILTTRTWGIGNLLVIYK